MFYGCSIQRGGPVPPARHDYEGALRAAQDALRLGWYCVVFQDGGAILHDCHPAVHPGQFVVNCQGHDGAVCCRAFRHKAKATAFARWGRRHFAKVLLERVGRRPRSS